MGYCQKGRGVEYDWFYFSNRTANGEEISYGYVDADPLDHLFRHTPIPTNANGNCYTSFESILTNKYYFYNIVQYGEKQISNLKEAIELKEEVRKFLDIKTNPPVFDCKVLWYTIDGLGKEENPGTKASQSFLAALQSFLNENREVFYNLGGDKIRNFMQPGKILVNRMEVRKGGKNRIIRLFMSLKWQGSMLMINHWIHFQQRISKNWTFLLILNHQLIF